MAILKETKEPAKDMTGCGYKRKKHQTAEYASATEEKRAYAKSSIDAAPIEYPDVGDKI